MEEIRDDVLYQNEVTILGIGNVILTDEGFGVRVVEYLDNNYEFPDNVQLVDGGTLGIELLQYVTGTQRLLVVDSINGGGEPGATYRFDDDGIIEHFNEKLSAHEIGIQDALALLKLTDKPIPDVVVIGAQPYNLEAGVCLSPEMEALLPGMAQQALKELDRWGVKYKPREDARETDFSVVAEELIRRNNE